jgi:hypothetical protein
VQWDWNYRTGYGSTALSILSLSTGLSSLASYVWRTTRSIAAALLAPMLILLNPNTLYLQSTPMTEPLLLGLSFLSLSTVARWMETPSAQTRRWAGWTLVALMLARYEGWCVGWALVACALARFRKEPARAFALMPYAAGAMMAFLLLGRGATGHWFVTSGFFVPDNEAFHRPFKALSQVFFATLALGGWPIMLVGMLGAGVCVLAATRRMPALAPLALFAAAALPLLAFFDGHPFRVRYMVALVAACGAVSPFAVAALPKRWQLYAAALLLALCVWTKPPLDASAPMVSEAQWETPFRVGRRDVSRYLSTAYDGTPILASMGSLAHYMQESSWIGLNLRNFVHEGNGDLWQAALSAPAAHVRWVLIEERAEGGDLLAAKYAADPAFLAGFTRAAEGGGMALFQKNGP